MVPFLIGAAVGGYVVGRSVEAAVKYLKNRKDDDVIDITPTKPRNRVKPAPESAEASTPKAKTKKNRRKDEEAPNPKSSFQEQLAGWAQKHTTEVPQA